MTVIIKQLMISTLIIVILSSVQKIVKPASFYSHIKNSTFECGFDLMSKLRIPFSLNFFVISIIFLIFDIELILILPFIFSMKMTMMMEITISLMLFFMILMIGFIYEWWMGMLNWLM